MVRLQDFLNSRGAIALGLAFSSMIPPRIGLPFARWLGNRVASLRGNAFVRAVRANQWTIHKCALTAKDLDHLTSDTFRSTGQSLYEFWHYFNSPKKIMEMVEFEPSFIRCFEQAQRRERGTLLVVPHMSNFDLIGRAVVLRGLNLHILSYPQPPGGYRWQNNLRQLPGLKVTPMSIQAIRQASETLRSGQTVLTGVDRPLPAGEDAKYRVRFFGKPATMPVFHIRLAIKHDLPITVLGGCRMPDGCYRLWASEPIPMRRSSDLVEETVQNAEMILTIIADFIRRAPQQWAMFYPVWPEMLDQVP